ncbi:MAG: L,D-transpeptidase family protein [Acidobacteria bacterium]|nr:L,D-transpeptidase family protein [Acidobacteriota bacterium]
MIRTFQQEPGVLYGGVMILLLTMIILSTGLVEADSSSYRVVIRKADRKLHLYLLQNGRQRLIKTYQVVLGNNPVGHKRKQGDSATPEGDYYITHKNSRSKFYLSLGISYPNIQDADAGLQAKSITKAQHKAIVNAINRQEKPPQNTKLGGDIFIHGGGTGMLFGKPNDWTLGCIALENADIKELFDLLPVKTPVRIDP